MAKIDKIPNVTENDYFSLHIEKIKSFNSDAMTIFNNLTITNIADKKNTIPNLNQENKYIITINPSDIMNLVQKSTNAFGETVSLNFEHQNKNIIIDMENHKVLNKFVDKIISEKNIGKYLSNTYVYDCFIDWLKEKIADNHNNDFMEYLIMRSNSDIKEHYLAIQISQLYICRNFNFMGIEFKKIDSAICDYWSNNKILKEEEIKKMFGKTLGSIKILSESNKAYELAQNMIEDSLSLIRILSPVTQDPRLTSYCSIYSRYDVNKLQILRIESEYKINDEYSANLCKYNPALQIDNGFLELIIIFEPLFNKLLNPKHSDFQEKIYKALNLYSRITLVSDYSDKLTYILVSLESILLKDGNEPILYNLSKRIAMFVNDNIDERKHTIKVVKDIYSIRSKFIHHGEKTEEITKLAEFMKIAHNFFISIIINQDKFENQLSFIQHLDDKMLSS